MAASWPCWTRSADRWLVSIAVAVLLAAPLGLGSPPEGRTWKCDDKKVVGEVPVCIVNSSHFSEDDLVLSFKGNIDISLGTFKSRWGRILIEATGAVQIGQAATLSAHDGVSITASGIESSAHSAINANRGDIVANSTRRSSTKLCATDLEARTITLIGADITVTQGTTLQASDSISMLGPSTDDGIPTGCSKGFVIDGASGKPVFLNAPVLRLACGDGTVHVTGNATIGMLNYPGRLGSLDIQAASVLVAPVVTISGGDIRVRASGSVQFNASTVAITEHGFAPSGWNDDVVDGNAFGALRITTPQDLILGSHTSFWNFDRVIVAAGSISVMSMRTTTVGADSCKNNQSSKQDCCSFLLGKFGDGTAGAEAAADAVSAGPVTGTNVTFDFAFVATGDIFIAKGVGISAASMMICSGATATLSKGVHLSADGRGCEAGHGDGHGETRESWLNCGAGGASHLGMGGAGGSYDMLEVVTCTTPHKTVDQLGELQPTLGASGGGCGIPPPCSDVGKEEVDSKSTGGGLIWLNAHDIVMESGSMITADGKEGTLVPFYNDQKISGGGAGGQILLYASSLSTHGGAPKISAQGGSSHCSKDAVSGGGGGGFIGARWKKGAMSSEIANIELNVSGGGLPEDCARLIPHKGSSALHGATGLVASLVPCKAGHNGLLCIACKIGKFSDDGMSCSDCRNKPAKATYFEPAWPNASCPYKCISSLPNVIQNPQCLNVVDYVFFFFGGTPGVVLILACFGLVVLFILARRSWKKSSMLSAGTNESMHQSTHWAASEHWCMGALSRVFPSRRRRTSSSFRNDARAYGGGLIEFTKEQLPYHVYRVYFQGQNATGCPWRLDRNIPLALEPMLSPEVWGEFVAEANRALAIRSRESHIERVLSVTYPPLEYCYVLLRRRQRAAKVKSITRCYSENAGRRALWNPLQLRDPGDGEMAVTFGCNCTATLGYLDFFDFSRSQLDWAPVDLRREVRLLVAHGHGTYAEPYAVDIGDPLVQHLAQTDFGAHNVCSVISTFNRIARLVHARELNDPGLRGGTTVHRLRTKVEQCAGRCGLSGLVHVVIVQHCAVPDARCRPPNGPSVTSDASVLPSDTSFSDLVPSLRDAFSQRGGRASHQRGATGRADSEPILGRGKRRLVTWSQGAVVEECELDDRERHSSETLSTARPSSTEPQRASSSRSANSASGLWTLRAVHREMMAASLLPEEAAVPASRSSQASSLTVGGNAAAKLCLAFTELPPRSRRRHNPTPEMPPCLSFALTSPIAQEDLLAYIEWSHLDQEGDGPTGGSSAGALSLPPCSAEWCLSFSWRDHGSGTPTTVLIVTMLLIFIDFLGFVMGSAMIWAVAPKTFVVSFLVPPFVQPIGLALGPTFVVSEAPWVGRLLAAFQLFGMIGPVMVVVISNIAMCAESLWFDVLFFGTLCLTKAALFVAVHLHVGNLEAAFDLSFAEASQADFLGRIFRDASGSHADLAGVEDPRGLSRPASLSLGSVTFEHAVGRQAAAEPSPF